MPLVDYSSSSSSEDQEENSKRGPSVKRRRLHQPAGRVSNAAVSNHGPSDMPPLPESFHDLYASTVRQSVVDDPTLHQGRKRQVPHIPGQWPSHLYIEWHPSQEQHCSLDHLLDSIQEGLESQVQLRRFLTSDLGAPLPLHISLSRPLSLPTKDKDRFLDRVREAIGSCGITSFHVSPAHLAWYKSPDSDRTFLIIRVESTGAASGTTSNPELSSLLNSCNAVARDFKQPNLYQDRKDESVSSAFHVSIAWTFGLPDEEQLQRGLQVLNQEGISRARTWKIKVSGIKAKIGNVVTHIPLSPPDRERHQASSILSE